jgi:general secretion pathway protein L
MPNRTLALDVSATTLRAALVESTLRTQRVLGFYTVARASGGDLAADLRALQSTHRLQWDEVVSALPGAAVTHRILTLPFRDRKRLDQTVPFELETQLPFELDDAVVDYQVVGAEGESAVVLAAYAPKAAVREHLAALAAAGVDPRAVDLAPLAVLNVLRMAAAEPARDAVLVTLESARTSVAVLRAGRLTGLRTLDRVVGENGELAALGRELRWSVRALGGDDAGAPTVFVAGEAAAAPGVAAALEQALGTSPRTIETLAVAGVPLPLRREQTAFATPLGLALRDRDRAFGIDFRRGEFAYHREREALWRGLAAAGGLALAALVLMATTLVLEGRRLESRRAELRGEIRSLFTSALPGVRTIVNEKAQLATEIAALEKQHRLYGGLAPSAPRALDVLRALSTGIPADVPLDIEELSLDGETVRIRGTTRAYENVETVKRGLATRPEFREVEAKDVRASVDGQRVDFRLALTLAHGDGT